MDVYVPKHGVWLNTVAEYYNQDLDVFHHGYNLCVFVYFTDFLIVRSQDLFVQHQYYYCCKVASSSMSRLEAQAGFFILLMKGIFYPYDLLTKC